jgi:hypothetical protein
MINDTISFFDLDQFLQDGSPTNIAAEVQREFNAWLDKNELSQTSREQSDWARLWNKMVGAEG